MSFRLSRGSACGFSTALCLCSQWDLFNGELTSDAYSYLNSWVHRLNRYIQVWAEVIMMGDGILVDDDFVPIYMKNA